MARLVKKNPHPSNESVVRVRRHPRDWRTGTVKLGDLSGFHMSDESGGVKVTLSRKFVHAYMLCDALINGEIAHSCAHGPAPHWIKVCIIKKINNPDVFGFCKQAADGETQHVTENCRLRNDVEAADLAFSGDDLRGLIVTLDDACDFAIREGRRPSIEVNGKIYARHDLVKVAALVPNEPVLQPRHQQLVDLRFKARQHGYSRTAFNLAHRANSIAESAGLRRVLMADAAFGNRSCSQ